MNEIDLTTKIEGLKKAIAEHNDFAGNYTSELAKVEQQLKDYNKIALPPVVFDEIYEAIERGLREFDFSDTDNFDKEFGIDYDGRVHLENFDFTNTTDLVEMIVEEVSKIFTEAECPEELDKTEDDNHPVVSSFGND